MVIALRLCCACRTALNYPSPRTAVKGVAAQLQLRGGGERAGEQKTRLATCRFHLHKPHPRTQRSCSIRMSVFFSSLSRVFVSVVRPSDRDSERFAHVFARFVGAMFENSDKMPPQHQQISNTPESIRVPRSRRNEEEPGPPFACKR